MIKLNKVIKTLILMDIFLQFGMGLFGPIFAVFVTGQIIDGNLQTVGYIAAIYWFVKSVTQPFIAHALDKNRGEKDDFICLVFGMFVANLIPLGYVFASFAWHLYILEFIRGLAMAFVIPTWYAIFTRHIEKGREAFSWSIDSTSLGFAAGIASSLSGILASRWGFNSVFILTTIFGLIAASSLLLIKDSLFTKDHYPHLIVPPEKTT